MTDLQKTRSDLTLMRAKHGAETPIGHRCSNLLEMLENLERAKALDGDPFMTAAQLAQLTASIKIQMDELAALTLPKGEL